MKSSLNNIRYNYYASHYRYSLHPIRWRQECQLWPFQLILMTSRAWHYSSVSCMAALKMADSRPDDWRPQLEHHLVYVSGVSWSCDFWQSAIQIDEAEINKWKESLYVVIWDSISFWKPRCVCVPLISPLKCLYRVRLTAVTAGETGAALHGNTYINLCALSTTGKHFSMEFVSQFIFSYSQICLLSWNIFKICI